MIDDTNMATRSAALQAQFREKLGVRSRDLAQAFKRAGRRLPRHLRGQGRVLIEAQQFLAHPKLAKRVDSSAVDRAFAAVSHHLKAVDAADARRGAWLGLAGAVVFNLLAVAVVFLVWLWWRGHI